MTTRTQLLTSLASIKQTRDGFHYFYERSAKQIERHVVMRSTENLLYVLAGLTFFFVVTLHLHYPLVVLPPTPSPQFSRCTSQGRPNCTKAVMADRSAHSLGRSVPNCDRRCITRIVRGRAAVFGVLTHLSHTVESFTLVYRSLALCRSIMALGWDWNLSLRYF